MIAVEVVEDPVAVVVETTDTLEEAGVVETSPQSGSPPAAQSTPVVPRKMRG